MAVQTFGNEGTFAHASTAFIGAVFDDLRKDARELFKSAMYDAEVASNHSKIFYLIEKIQMKM